MRHSGAFIGVFVFRLLLWGIVGLLDGAYLYRSGFAPHLMLQSIVVYAILGAAIGVIAILLALLYRPRGERAPDPRRSLGWDVGLLFLIAVGFRINELYLPAIGDPKSVIGNVILVAAAVVLGMVAGRLLARLRISVSIAVLAVVGLIVASLNVIEIRNRNARELQPTEVRQNIVLITLDTVRADHLGCYGYERDTSPNLDEFAAENTLFSNCRTPMPLTSPAHASLFSGELPHTLGVFTNISQYPSDAELMTLAEELDLAQYRTAGFPAAVHLGSRFNFDRGFEVYNESTVLNGPDWLQSAYRLAPVAILSRLGIVRETYLARNSRQVNRAFLHWLDSLQGDKRPFFCWVHYFDAHSPYQPPEEYWRRYDADYQGNVTGSRAEIDLINDQLVTTGGGVALPDGFTQEDIDNLVARYDGEIRYQDESLGELFDALRDRGLWDDTAIVIVSDHGEGMYDDGYFGHNFTLREYEIRLACAIKGPGIDCDENRPLGITDLTHYIREIAGVDPPSGCRITGGREMVEPDRNPFVSMVFLRSHCLIDGPYKLIRTWEGEGRGISYSLYNIERDPAGRDDLYDPADEFSLGMKAELQQWLDENDADFPSLIAKEGTLESVEPETLEMLRSLGYLY